MSSIYGLEEKTQCMVKQDTVIEPAVRNVASHGRALHASELSRPGAVIELKLPSMDLERSRGAAVHPRHV